MYRCTECKEEYKNKPDYCKCGNDEFDEFTPITNSEPETAIKETVKKDIPIKRILSICFFVLCLIISVIPWLFKSEKPQKTVQKAQPEVNKTIPDIEKIWENTEYKAPPPIDEPKTVKVVDNTVKETSKPVIKQPQKVKTSAPSKPIQKSTNAQTYKPKTQTTAAPKSQPAPKNTQQQPNIKLPPSVLNPKPSQSSAPAPAPKPEPPKMNPNDFIVFKGEIRTALLAKLNLTAIQGSGDCAIEFSVDNTGKLINRNFIYKSANKSVNDEVYLMLMRLPYFKQPPVHYNGEKIKLKFYINNGYYEITFI